MVCIKKDAKRFLGIQVIARMDLPKTLIPMVVPGSPSKVEGSALCLAETECGKCHTDSEATLNSVALHRASARIVHISSGRCLAMS